MGRTRLFTVCCVLGSFLLAPVAGGPVAWGQGAAKPVQRPTTYPGQSLYFVLMPQIQKELEIVPEQKDKLNDIQKKMNERLQESFKTLNDVPAAERTAKYYEIYQQVGEDTDKQMREVLLPMQLDRLRQIQLQMQLAQTGYGYGASNAFGSEELAKALGITPEQIEEMKKKEEEVRQEIQEKTREFYKKLQEDSQEKLMSVLTPEQRAKLKRLVGEKFEWQTPAWQGGQGTVKTPEKK